MSKYTVKTELSNITQLKDGTFDYNEKIISMHWTPQDEYSYRKQYHLKDNEGYEYESDYNRSRTHKD
jgi:hypothetical protein